MSDKLLISVAPCIPPYLACEAPGLDLSPEAIADEVLAWQSRPLDTARSIRSCSPARSW